VTRRLGWVVAALAAAVLGGCGDDDPPVGCDVCPPQPTEYPDRSSPQNVLEDLVLSYQNRDSTEYKALYDTSYVGTSTNLNDPPVSQVSTFRFSDEVSHIAALAKSPTIVSVSLDLGARSSWTRLPSDDVTHPDWAQIQLPTVHLSLIDGPSAYEVHSSNPMTFRFTPRVDSSSPTDTLWRIVRWDEIGP